MYGNMKKVYTNCIDYRVKYKHNEIGKMIKKSKGTFKVFFQHRIENKSVSGGKERFYWHVYESK